MKNSAPIVLAGAVFLTLSALSANAQATRTWVSGVGDDMNMCTRVAPCKTFAGAIAKTAANGVIDCLDSGGFGGVTITISITINCEEVMGSVLVSGTNGINVAGSGIIVNLRGLNLEGLGTGVTGINVTQAAAVYIRKSVIHDFNTDGINFTGGGTLIVSNSVIHSNGTGIVADGSGGTVNMALRDVIVHKNSSNGVSITTAAGATIDRSTLANNGGTGLIVNGSSVVAMVGNSTITGNATGVSAPLGKLYSFKDNHIGGNTADGTPITAFPGPGGALQ